MNNVSNFVFNKFLFLNLNFSPLNIFVYFLFFLILIITIYGYLKIPKKKFLLIALRVILIFSIFSIFLEPSFEYVKYSKSRKNIIILKDNSKSLVLPLNSKNNRIRNLNSFFEKNESFISKLSDAYDIGFYFFGDDIDIGDINDKIEAKENQTRLRIALREILKNYSLEEISSLIIASDFIDTDKKFTADDYALKKFLKGKVPVNFILPEKKILKDIYIKKISYDSYAFVQNTTSIDVEISSFGYDNLLKKVYLHKNGKIIDVKNVKLKNTEVSRITFSFKPERVGNYIYSVSIKPEEDETILINNRKDFIMNIIRDKIRVVQVVGKPSWDVRFMRQLLKNHPDIDLVSFFILRTANDVYLVPEKELSLIPFPSYELFYEKLNTFDLIILQNFNYAPYGITPYLGNIRDFVLKRGGGLVMIGGMNSFNAGGYKGTPIEEVLPVALPDIPLKESICYKNSHYNITKEGLKSPFFKFANNLKKQKSVLKSLPLAEGFNKTILKQGATLIAKSDKVCDNKSYPLIAVMQVGNGRSMVVTTDNQWTWNFHSLMDMSHKQLYTYFWDKAIKWLIKDPDMKLIKISFDNNIISSDENLSLLVKIYDYHYKPLKNGKLYYKIINIDSQKVILKREVQSDDSGVVQLTEKIAENGRYKIEFKTYLKGRLLEENYAMFIVKDKSAEFDNPQMDMKLIKEFSEAGVNILNYDDNADKISVKKDLSKVVEKKYIKIWDNIYVLIFLIVLFLLEIYIKRYKI